MMKKKIMLLFFEMVLLTRDTITFVLFPSNGLNLDDKGEIKNNNLNANSSFFFALRYVREEEEC